MKFTSEFADQLRKLEGDVRIPNLDYQIQQYTEALEMVKEAHRRGWWAGFISGVFAGVVGMVLVAVF